MIYMSVLMILTTVIRFSAYMKSAFWMMMVCLYLFVWTYCLRICTFFLPEPYIVEFVETIYTVNESELMVEVCVNLTSPPQDILEETVRVNVFNNMNSVYIPIGAEIASMLNCHVFDGVV